MRKKWRMSTILRLFFILIVIIPMLLICSIILNIYKRDILQQNTDRSLQTAQALAYSVNQEIGRLSGLFASIGLDEDVISTVYDIYRQEGFDRQVATYKLKVLIEKYTASVSGRVLSVNFYFDDGSSYSYLKNLMQRGVDIRKEEWYQTALEKPNFIHFIGMRPNSLYGNYNPYMMVAALSPGYSNPSSQLEMILFTFESSAFDHILQSRDNTESTLYIVDGEGEIIASNTILKRGSKLPLHRQKDAFPQSQGSYVDETDGDKTLITYAKVDASRPNWVVVQKIPYADLMANYKSVNSFVWFLAILIILAFILVSFYFVSNMTKPILELLRQMVRVTHGDLNAKINVTGSLEIASLGHSFNHMTERIRELIDQHERQEVEKRKAEFAALQSQINPHFLINTLNSIKFMALISKADNIRNMTHALTRLIASSFNRGGLVTTVAEEVDHLRHYLYIMEIRFGKSIVTEWDIAPDTEKLYLLKLLIQPILENSFIHGLKDIDYQGVIVISIRLQGDDLLITVADNGVGMHEETVQVEEGTTRHTFSGMGNMNVHNRIQLHYGPDYGLQYEKNSPHGTVVHIRLPQIREPDEQLV
ncbi:sensor histidine kinase [Paenibacillus chibensis]|uniref:Sensor histidine kinase n=1 Tax=Paenibacillus chibensis TaxID=59846 RepID=A0ABU6PRZ5_9BACL|nr:sensor histidine kinase [Paenibacillus chibensis]